MPVSRKVKIAAAILWSFIGLVVLIGFLTGGGILTPSQGGLMVVMLLGMYVGFGILIGVYRLVMNLDLDGDVMVDQERREKEP